MNLSVLIAEHQEAEAKVLASVLQQRGFKTIVTDNGRTASELLKLNVYDALISPVMMPEVDGFELLSQVRNSPHLINTWVGLSTVHACEELDSIAHFQPAPDQYICKPYREQDLLALQFLK